MEETELARKAIAGDENSFTILIQSKRERLYRMAYTYVRNREDALEVVQETVYRAFLAIHKLQQPQYFNTWLTKIAINSALDFVRKSKKVVYAEPGAEGSYVPNYNEESLDLREALGSLDEKSRTAIMLRYFEDMQLKDIADVLDTPLSSVKSIIYRGLERLKIKLEESESIG